MEDERAPQWRHTSSHAHSLALVAKESRSDGNSLARHVSAGKGKRKNPESRRDGTPLRNFYVAPSCHYPARKGGIGVSPPRKSVRENSLREFAVAPSVITQPARVGFVSPARKSVRENSLRDFAVAPSFHYPARKGGIR